MFVTVREDAFEEGYVFKFCRGTYSEVLGEKLRMEVASDQTNLNVMLRFVVKRLHCTDCLNSWATTCGIL